METGAPMTTTAMIATIPKARGEEVRITLEEYRGRHLFGVRIWADYDGSGEARPTKKGVSFKIEQLPGLIEALQAAAAEARQRGLLPDERSAAAVRQDRYRKRHARNGSRDGGDGALPMEGTANVET
jgi:hypothetical protein